MDELRFVRREDQSLIVVSDTGAEYKLEIDSGLLSEIKQFNRRDRETPRVSPRDIQRMLRAGKAQSEIIETTGALESDIVRYGEPVFAERRFIISSAQAVSVRTLPTEGSEQEFGEVMKTRLSGLQAEAIEWSTWKDEDSGWMIGLEFISHDVAHHAVWQFDHKKSQLSPTTPDAVSLSRQGDLGDRLIPKLRAVEQESPQRRFEVPFDPDALTADLQSASEVTPLETQNPHNQPGDGLTQESQAAKEASGEDLNEQPAEHDTQPVLDPHAEFLRRREIDQRAMSTPPSEIPDLSQTADLLDALRQRRTAREAESASQNTSAPSHPEQSPRELFPSAPSVPTSENNAAEVAEEASASPTSQELQGAHDAVEEGGSTPEESENGSSEKTKKPRGRASIPSWDDILFGTRSEETP